MNWLSSWIFMKCLPLIVLLPTIKRFYTTMFYCEIKNCIMATSSDVKHFNRLTEYQSYIIIIVYQMYSIQGCRSIRPILQHFRHTLILVALLTITFMSYKNMFIGPVLFNKRSGKIFVQFLKFSTDTSEIWRFLFIWPNNFNNKESTIFKLYTLKQPLSKIKNLVRLIKIVIVVVVRFLYPE